MRIVLIKTVWGCPEMGSPAQWDGLLRRIKASEEKMRLARLVPTRTSWRQPTPCCALACTLPSQAEGFDGVEAALCGIPEGAELKFAECVQGCS